MQRSWGRNDLGSSQEDQGGHCASVAWARETERGDEGREGAGTGSLWALWATRKTLVSSELRRSQWRKCLILRAEFRSLPFTSDHRLHGGVSSVEGRKQPKRPGGPAKQNIFYSHKGMLCHCLRDEVALCTDVERLFMGQTRVGKKASLSITRALEYP